MKKLIERLAELVKGSLTGFDRIVLKGFILPLMSARGAMNFCRINGILNKDYKNWMMKQSAGIVETADQYAKANCGQAITTISTWRIRKEALAHERQRAEKIENGLIGIWSCLESASSYRAHYCSKTGYPQLQNYQTRCKHLYFNLDHHQFGFMNIRLLYISDYQAAQRLLEKQLDARFTKLLDGFLPIVFPTIHEILGPHLSYYWTMWQSEWATDLIFDSPGALNSIADSLLCHAHMTATSTRVLRYLDLSLRVSGKLHGRSAEKQLSAKISRHLRLLRANGIIRKLPKQNKYQLTLKGVKLTNLLNAFIAASTEQLMQMAA